MKMKKSVSLVLGSGGARGYAHIGVIEELEKHGYEISSVSGSSMGTLIGAVYACGKLKEFKEWVLTLDFLDVARLVDFSLDKKGIIEGDKVFDILEDMIDDVMIEELPITFTAVATDIVRQKEVWIQKGRLLDAVRASVAIPTIFTPKKIDNRYLVDGGVLNPLPIAPTTSDNTDITIAVSLNANSNREHEPQDTEEKKEQDKEEQDKIKNIFFNIENIIEKLFNSEDSDRHDEMGMFEVMGQTIDIMENAILKCKMAGYSPDITIDIPNDVCGFYEFNRASEIIEIGRKITRHCQFCYVL